MIPFNADKITYDYVYISRITKHNILVVSDDNGEPYTPDGVQHKRRASGETAIPIHKKVFDLYESHNSLLEFHIGRRACIFYYDGYPLMIDVFMPNRLMANGRPVAETEWSSLNIGAINHLKTMLDDEAKGRKLDAYIDGETIFFKDPNNVDVILCRDESDFFLQPVRYIRLSKMAVSMRPHMAKFFAENRGLGLSDSFKDKEKEDKKGKTASSEEKDEKKEKDEKGEKKEQQGVIVLKSGHVLGYNPFGYESENQEYVVYSPVVSKESVTKLFGTFETQKGKTEKVQQHFNLNWLIKAGRVIGRHYSFEETDFLDIPQVIKDTGIINLASDISYQSKSNYPVNLHVDEALAYMFKFLYKETDLNIYRDLSKLFVMAVGSGTVSSKKHSKVFQEGKSIQDMPIRKINIANIGKSTFKEDENDSFESYKRKTEKTREFMENYQMRRSLRAR